ncbi:PREDICTED: MLO-like protein 13 isoform X1 [Brassica oleracea var. oleracea]|nr:PREDICTED: MLO-like protein 13 isoform X1 [Brassica oleracea var. oleracea]
MDTLEREKTLKKLKIIEFAWDRRKVFYAFYYTRVVSISRCSKMAEEENSLEYTPTWVVAFICFIIVLLSLLAERGLHHLGKYLKRRKQDALFEALQKLKEELMLLGFISLLLTVSQTAIRHICVPPALVSNMFPCKKPLEEEHHAPETSHSLVFNTRHLLSTGASPDHCTTKGKVPLISVEALHHLHIFIFVLAVIHVIFCASTMVLGGARIQQWKRWEDNFKKIPSQKDASKPGHAHAHHAHAHAHALHELFNANHEFFKMHAGGFWRRSVVISWLRSFCKQFYGSVTKSEYIALRHGFIMTHCPTNPTFNFHKYMLRTVEMDFKKVVTISWYLWLFVVVFLLLNVGGWNTYFWLSFLPLILLLMVGTKLENIISSLAVDVCEKRNRGEQAVITPSDELFWFHRPEIVLQLVHFILFQNSFEIAFFFWILFTYGIHSCIMEKLGFLIPRLVMGVLVQVLCSYSTLPLYALVTQMGSKFKKGIFDELVHSTLEVWLSDTRNKGESTSEAHRMEIEPTIPESFNVQVNELMECDNP